METSDNKKYEISQLDKCPVTSAPIINRPEWFEMDFGDPSCTATVSVIGDNIIYSKAVGYIQFEFAQKYIAFINSIVEEVFYSDKKFYLIEDYSEHTGSSLTAKNSYIKYLTLAHPNRLAQVVVSPSKILAFSMRISRQIGPRKNIGLIASSYEEAIGYIHDISATTEEPSEGIIHSFENDEAENDTFQQEVFTQEEVDLLIDDLINYTGSLDWGKPELAPAIIGNSNPFKPIYDSIDLIRNDYAAILKDKDGMQAQIVKATKLASIGELASGVGHEINNPVAIISGHGHLIKKELEKAGFKDESIYSSFEKQQIATKRITNVVNGLRIYARDDTKEQRYFDVLACINESSSLVKTIFEKLGIKIITNHNCDPLLLFGVRSRFQVVLMNLFNNAKDAMPDGGQLTIKTQPLVNSIAIYISDTGRGIDKKTEEKIFDSFFTTKTAGSGTGLGLSISNSIIEEMGGTIHLSSSSECGASFRIVLPACSPESIEALNIVENREILSSNKILVVDDEEDLCRVVESTLSQFGMQVTTAENGLVALNIVKKQPFDYILVDLKMPLLGGVQFLEQAHEAKLLTNTKILIMTSFDKELSDNKELLSKLDYEVLNKPFNLSTLFDVIKGPVQS